MKHWVIVLALSALLPGSCKKHNSETANNGYWQIWHTGNSLLPDNQVNAVCSGEDNTLWVGTAKGLVRIKDNQWTVFNSNNTTLPAVFIQALAAESNGTIWVGTNNGLAKYDGNHWTIYNSGNSILPQNAIMSIAYDKLFHRVWVGTEQGIVRIDENNHWTLFNETNGNLALSMTTDKQGALWIGAHDHFNFRGRIIKLLNNQWTFHHLDQMGYESVFPYSIAVDNNNSVVALLTGTAVKTVIRLRNNQWEELESPSPLAGFRAMATEENKVWVGGNQLMLFGSQPKKIDLPVQGASVLSMTVGTNGHKWLGTLNDGLFVYKQQ